MSGVIGLLDLAGTPVVERELDAALRQLQHCGPDGSGRACDGPVAIGHQHHVTTPEAKAANPPERYGDLVVAGDVRLDGRDVLCRTLGVGGTDKSGSDGGIDAGHDHTVSDHELLARAYDRWGTDCAAHLLGAFAFVVWDADRDRLYCARDHVGVKPLYAAATGDRFVAASEPGPVLDLAALDRQPDEHRIGDFLVGHYPDDGRSFYDGLDRVPPGHWTVASEDGVRTECYWSPADVDPNRLAGVTDYERRFRELFERAVADRLRTVDPPSSLLSGGIDSSSIASVASDLCEAADRPPLRTFSAVFDTVTSCDERQFVDPVLEAGRFDPQFVAGDEVDPLADLDAHLERRRAPFYPALMMLVWELFGAVGRSDADVVLQGYGGDQTMGSDPRGYLRGLARRGQLPTLASEVRGYAQLYGVSPRDVLWRDVVRPQLPQQVRAAWQRVRDVDHVDRTMVSVDRSFADRSGLTDRLATDARRPAARTQRELRERALLPGEPTFNLELNAHVGAHFGVEPRFPYFDVRLIEFSLALPPGQTVAGGLDRTIVRDALAHTLPEAVRTRSDKMEFSPNVVHCTREYAIETIERTLFDGDCHATRYLDADALRASFAAFESDGDVAAARELLLSTTLERWLRDHTAASP